LIKKITLSY